MKTSILILTLALTGCTQLESLIESEAQANDQLNREAVNYSRAFLCDRLSSKIKREMFPSINDQQALAQFCGHELRVVEIPLKPEDKQ